MSSRSSSDSEYSSTTTATWSDMDYGQIVSSESSSHEVYQREGYHGAPYDSKRNLIVNYLPQTYTDKALFDLFVPFGALHSVKIMREAKSGYSYGYGFVNFYEEHDAAVALERLNGKPIDNKRIKVSIARPPSDDIKDTNVYITNLPRDITEVELMKFFEPYGEIVQRNLLKDKVTHLPRGSAFVRYDRREQASAAIAAMNNRIPDGATDAIRVKLAQDHGKQKAAYLAGFQDALHKRPPPKSLLFN